MKRTLVLLSLIFLASAAFAQTIGDQINDLNKQLTEASASSAANGAKMKKAKDKLDDINFAANAYNKQSARLESDYADLGMKFQQHNGNRCTEQCTQGGGCDGSCAWYNQEATALTNAKANLDQQAGTLEQIRQNVSQQTQDWAAEAKALLAEDERLNALMDNLHAQIADLRGQYNQCRGAIVQDSCDAPNNPDLNAKCERMHAACGRLFDGN